MLVPRFKPLNALLKGAYPIPILLFPNCYYPLDILKFEPNAILLLFPNPDDCIGGYY